MRSHMLGNKFPSREKLMHEYLSKSQKYRSRQKEDYNYKKGLDQVKKQVSEASEKVMGFLAQTD